jgi:hypothetical protein
VHQRAYERHVSDDLPLRVKASVMLKKLLKQIVQLEAAAQ